MSAERTRRAAAAGAVDWFDNDRLFAELLRTGHVWAERVGRELRLQGPHISVTPMAWRESIDRRDESRKPAAIVLASQLTSAMLVIPTSSRDSWTTSRRHDRVRGISDLFTTCRGSACCHSPTWPTGCSGTPTTDTVYSSQPTSTWFGIGG
jgi:hypothetical protein